MNNPYFSILIPCYNAVDTINNSINSCIQQEYKDFQIILVDDGSNDGTLNVLKQFNLPYFKYFINKNQHQGKLNSRNFLIKKANGKYIVWLEPFDEISPDFLKTAHQELENKNYDILEYSVLWKTNEKTFDMAKLSNSEYQNNNCLDVYMGRNDALQDCFYGKVIRTDILKNIQAPEYNINVYEEAFYSVPMFYQAKKFACKELPMYSYNGFYDRFYGESEKNAKNLKKICKIKYNQIKYNIKFLEEKKLFDKYNTYCFDKIYIQNLFQDIINIQKKEQRKEVLQEFYKYFFIHIGANLSCEQSTD